MKHLSIILAPPVTAIFNTFLQEGYVPEKGKCASITPIPKTSPERSVEKNIRLITLTCILAKELERIAMKALRKHVLPDKKKQFGNRKNVLTIHMLVELLHQWHQVIERNSSIRIVFLDYAKAFDCVKNNILLDKIKSTGIHPLITKWLASFLTNRTQFVKLGQHISSKKRMKGILPQ